MTKRARATPVNIMFNKLAILIDALSMVTPATMPPRTSAHPRKTNISKPCDVLYVLSP